MDCEKLGFELSDNLIKSGSVFVKFLSMIVKLEKLFVFFRHFLINCFDFLNVAVDNIG